MKLSERVSRMEPSATLAMDALTNQMVRQGLDVVNFTVGQPDFDTPDNVKAAGIEAIESGFTKYTPAGGIPELKEAVSRKFARDNDLHYATDEIVICVGAKHALYNIFQVLLDPGDEVIIPAPYWVSYLEQVRLAGGIPVIIEGQESRSFKVTAKQIGEAITPRTKVLIINSPANPTGAIYTWAELEKVAQLAVERGITVVSDEVYEPFNYTGHPHVSIAQISPAAKAQTLVVHGVSKSHSMTGWRIGYVLGNKAVVAAIASLQSHSTSNATSIAQRAAVEALEGPRNSVDIMVGEFMKRRDYLVERLSTMPGRDCQIPQGAFYAFPNVASFFGKKYQGHVIQDAADLAQLLLKEAHVAVVPGNAFGAQDYLRLSYAASLDRIKTGLERIERFVRIVH